MDEAIAASSGSVRDALNIALAEVGQLLQRVAELETELARSREMFTALFDGGEDAVEIIRLRSKLSAWLKSCLGI